MGDARVLVDEDSGSAFVVRDARVYPAMNLASAMLAAMGQEGTASAVRHVNSSTLATLPKVQLLGIRGAPNQVPAEADLVPAAWTVCDLVAPDETAAPGQTLTPATTVMIGLPVPVAPVERAAAAQGYYLVLEDGVQEVGAVVADIVRATTGQSPQVPLVPPSDIASADRATRPIPVAAYPTTRPRLVATEQAPGLCLDWRLVDGSPSRRLYPVRTLPMPAGATSVAAPPGPSGGSGSATGAADAVYLAPGHGAVLGQSVDGLTANTGNLFLVTDQGIRYPVVSMAALKALGLGQTISAAPAELVSLLPLGPTLDPAPARRFFGAQPGMTDG